MRKNFLLIVFALLLLGGCKKDKDVHVVRVQAETPDVTTTANAATISGTYNYVSTMKSVVIAYGKDESLSSPQKVTAEHTRDSYSVTINNLESGTTYYYHCIFDTGYGASESEQWSFTTQGGGGTIAGHAYVDLGLPSGLLWATCNVGASKPEDYGDYFAWGETEPKDYYDWSTYKWCNGSYNTLTKYNTQSNYGTVDNKTVLDPEDDAARANWGGAWRMPTREEMHELTGNCTNEWTTQNGVNGREFTGPNGNSIFLPAAGYYYCGSLNNAGSRGVYWSSSLNTGSLYFAYNLYFDSGDEIMESGNRAYGQSVRPVCPSQSVSAPTVTTSSVSNITQTTATCGGNVTSDGGAAVTARGVCWSTSQNPTVSDSHTADGGGTGSFTSSITGLTANTTYYVRAYATNSAGTSYGEQKSFYTDPYNGHEYIDLGLPSGLLWATSNVGADSPEDYGNYYAWGETETKSRYSWSTYKWCNGSYNHLTKYNGDWNLGTIDNKTVLDPEDDAAHANLGGDWRMPTHEEMNELKNNCTWIWTNQGGKNGYCVTGSNGKSIFLPAAGYYDDGSLNDTGSHGYYWSSSLRTDNELYAYDLDFSSSYVVVSGNNYRRCGRSVRPVCPSQK